MSTRRAGGAVARVAGFGLAVVAALMWSAIGEAREPRFGGETTVVAVEIPVQVLVEGQPVRGLTRENFEVLDGRRRQEIIGFEVVDLATATTASGRALAVTPEVAPAGRRNFLLLFDLTNSEPQALVRAREAASALVRNSLHPTDLVAVATWSFTAGTRLLLGFTSDRGQVDAAIETLGFVDLHNTTPDPLGIVLASLETTPGAPSRATSQTRADVDAIVLENAQDLAATERATDRRVKGDEIKAFTQGGATLAKLMAGLDGRKHVVLLSQGFDSSVLLGSTDANLLAESNRSAASGEIWNVRSDEVFGSGRSVNQLEEMLDAFRRADCTIQAVDIGGLAAAGEQGFGKANGRDTLLTMAHDTGGQFYENFNDLGTAMGKMLEATSVTYVLTIQPQNLKFDGKFRELKVRLQNGPSSARLVHRPGYYAPTTYAERGAIERQIDNASLIVSGRPGGDLVAHVAAAAFRGEGGRMHVPVVVEADGALLLAAQQGGALPLAVYVYAFDEAGAVRDFIAQSLQLNVAQVGARLVREPLKYVADLRLPPGSYTLRTLLRAGGEGAFWLGEVPLVVSEFASDKLVAVTPLAPEPMTAGIVVRSSSSAERTKGLAFPFVLGEEFYLPRGLPTATKQHPARFCLNVYGLTPDPAEVSVRLVDAEGRSIAGAAVRVVGRAATDQPGLSRFELEVDPGGAADGDYTVELSVGQQGRTAGAAATLRVGA